MGVQEGEGICLLQGLYDLFDNLLIPLISRPLAKEYIFFNSHLDFGCGKGYWTYYTASRNPGAYFVGYDSNSDRVRIANQGIPRLVNLAFTNERRKAQVLGAPFTSVGSSFVFHEAGETMFEEYRDFIGRGDAVFVVDYNLKGVSIDEFFRLSSSKGERRLIGENGLDVEYLSHTRFDLKDCCREAEKRGFQTVDTHEIGRKFFCWIGEAA